MPAAGCKALAWPHGPHRASHGGPGVTQRAASGVSQCTAAPKLCACGLDLARRPRRRSQRRREGPRPRMPRDGAPAISSGHARRPEGARSAPLAGQ